MLCRTWVKGFAIIIFATPIVACSGDQGPSCEDITEVKTRVQFELVGALANQHYHADESWTTTEMLEVTTEALVDLGVDIASDHDFFEDGPGDRRPIKALDDMSESELEAYNAWVNSDLVADEVSGNRVATYERMSDGFEGLEGKSC